MASTWIDLTHSELDALIVACGFIEAGGGIDGEPSRQDSARARACRKLIEAREDNDGHQDHSDTRVCQGIGCKYGNQD
jgi:O-acetyl-ADP-ribose deacetylase (regulator of RNase III)